MELSEILARCDHTLLAPDATWEQIRALCDDGVRYRTASVCIPPSFVENVNDYLGGKCPICTVVGFPNGYSTTASKVFEATDAIQNGADEIDMVIQIGWAKEGRWKDLLTEIQTVKAACKEHILKVIVEACLLTTEEKLQMCDVITRSGADYIKTSTGFSSGGATREDVKLFVRHVGPHVKVKAAGGISGLQDARDFIALGADRLGSSRIVSLAREQERNLTCLTKG